MATTVLGIHVEDEDTAKSAKQLVFSHVGLLVFAVIAFIVQIVVGTATGNSIAESVKTLCSTGGEGDDPDFKSLCDMSESQLKAMQNPLSMYVLPVLEYLILPLVLLFCARMAMQAKNTALMSFAAAIEACGVCVTCVGCCCAAVPLTVVIPFTVALGNSPCNPNDTSEKFCTTLEEFGSLATSFLTLYVMVVVLNFLAMCFFGFAAMSSMQANKCLQQAVHTAPPAPPAREVALVGPPASVS